MKDEISPIQHYIEETAQVPLAAHSHLPHAPQILAVWQTSRVATSTPDREQHPSCTGNESRLCCGILSTARQAATRSRSPPECYENRGRPLRSFRQGRRTAELLPGRRARPRTVVRCSYFVSQPARRWLRVTRPSCSTGFSHLTSNISRLTDDTEDRVQSPWPAFFRKVPLELLGDTIKVICVDRR